MNQVGLAGSRAIPWQQLHQSQLADGSIWIAFVDARAVEHWLSVRATIETDVRCVLVGELSARAAFDCARRGLHGWVEDPASPEAIVRAMEVALRGPEELQRVAVSQLGRLGLREAQRLVRKSMIEEALMRTEGNRHAAARLLQVDRRAVQLALKELEMESGGSAAPAAPPSELERLASDRVRRYGGSVVTWRELPVQSVDWVQAVFGRLSELGSQDPIDLVIDLTEADYPDPVVRDCLQSNFQGVQHLNSVSISVGRNEPLALAAHLVLAQSQDCPITLHADFLAAVGEANRAGARRSA